MVNIRKIREVVEMPCPCNGIVNQLIEHITPCLQNLGIFDLQNVFVVCLDLQRNGDGNGYIPTNNSSIYLQGQFQQTSNLTNQIVSSAGVYVVLGNSCKLGCDNRSNITYIGESDNLKERIGNFIYTLRGSSSSSNHSGAETIREALVDNKILQTCLYILGFPIADETIKEWIEVNSGNKKFLQKFVENYFRMVKNELKEIGILNDNIENRFKNHENRINSEIIEIGGKSLEEIKKELSNLSLLKIIGDEVVENIETEIRIEKIEILENVKKKIAKKDLSEKLEGCFYVTYAYSFNVSPCIIERVKPADFIIFRFGNNPNNINPKEEIEKLLKDVDSIFQLCIQNC